MSVADAAREIDAGFRAGPEESLRVLRRLYATQVEYRHDPPLASDGLVDSSHLADVTEAEAAAISSMVTDHRYGEVAVTVDGDEIEVSARLQGALQNGTEVSLPVRMWLRVDGGWIVAATQILGDEGIKAWTDVAVAAGLVAPDEARSQN